MRREIRFDLLVTKPPIDHLSGFSRWLRSIQKEHHITCKEIRQKGISYEALYYWRHHAKRPQYHRVAYLCDALVECRPALDFKSLFDDALASRDEYTTKGSIK